MGISAHHSAGWFPKQLYAINSDYTSDIFDLSQSQMSNNIITLKNAIFIHRSPETVWDFTQDYSKRALWDSNVVAAEVLSPSPNRIVRLKIKGGTMMTLAYKLDDRPHKTSLASTAVHSPFIKTAGGSWNYEKKRGYTMDTNKHHKP